MGPMVHIKTYIFHHFHHQYLVLLTRFPRNSGVGVGAVVDSAVPFFPSTLLGLRFVLLRGTITNRTYGANNIYIYYIFPYFYYSNNIWSFLLGSPVIG